MKYYNSKKWHFRNNEKRKKADSNKGKHPSLIIGESDKGNQFLNIGLTSSKKRGHHNNISISDPQNWKNKSYLRDDIKLHDKNDLKQILYDYKLNPHDIDKVMKMIDKYKKKNSH